MAYPPDVRRQARDLYVRSGRSFRHIAERVGVGKTTLLRWARREDWEALREQERAIELGSRKLLLRMVGAAAEQQDAQLTYAAVKAARLAGVSLGDGGPPVPRPKEVAVVLLDVLGGHPDIGPVVRRFRNEAIRLVLHEVKRMEAASPSGASS